MISVTVTSARAAASEVTRARAASRARVRVMGASIRKYPWRAGICSPRAGSEAVLACGGGDAPDTVAGLVPFAFRLVHRPDVAFAIGAQLVRQAAGVDVGDDFAFGADDGDGTGAARGDIGQPRDRLEC